MMFLHSLPEAGSGSFTGASLFLAVFITATISILITAAIFRSHEEDVSDRVNKDKAVPKEQASEALPPLASTIESQEVAPAAVPMSSSELMRKVFGEGGFPLSSVTHQESIFIDEEHYQDGILALEDGILLDQVEEDLILH